MTKKITKLTADQEAQISVYRDHWLEIGISTKPINFENAKAAVAKIYESTELKAPAEYLMADSPMHAFNLLKAKNVSKHDIMASICYGNNEAAWLGFYEYFKKVVGLKCCNKLDTMFELARECGWVFMFDTLAVIVERPVSIMFDNEKRLHCDHAPAIEYRDGYSVYAWHGVRFPAEWIEDKASLTAKKALTWVNIEQRRVACEILGWNIMIEELNAKVIDADGDPMIGTLFEVDIPDIGKEKFLRVLCGTGRTFALPVPPDMKTAIQANAWGFGYDDVNTFGVPEIRT